ncbi:MAG TPA: BamA/TamA family outer membrane protein [Gemmatimonadaceae bacterium]|nr:BamA/TamA family outer membrane protein [Gemmatimonadaceae bacterium]
MRHTPWVLGAVLLLTSATLAAQASDADQPDNPEIVKLTIRGVKAVEKGELQQSIATDESHCRGLILTPFCWISKSPAIYAHNYLDRTELRRDVLRIRVFYWKRGYREATVDTVITPKAGGVAVTFNVTEGPPTLVRKIAVGPETPVLSAKDIRTAMVLKTGKPLNLLQLDSSLVFLSDKLWERGYADAVVKTDTLVVDDSSHWADVSVLVEPRWKATIGEIRIAGNEQVSERTIRNSLAMHEGELYRRSEVVESQRNLYESQLFRHAAIVVPPQGDSVKLIEVTVREAPLRDARISTGFNTVEFVQLEGRFRHYNFLGGARQLDLSGAIGNILAPQLNARWPFRNAFTAVQPGDLSAFERPTWQASADIRQPWFQNSRNTIGLGVFAHRRAQPPVYIDRGEGVSATFTREVTVRAPASATYRFEFTRIEAGDLYFCVYYGVCDSPTISAQRKPQRLSPFSLTAQIDRTNEAFSPTRGVLGRFELEGAARYTGSDYGYARSDLDVATYRQIGGQRNVLALHVRAGIVRPIGGDALHPRKRFYAGGSQSVRGYGENQLGPRALTVPASKLATIYGCNVAQITSCDPNGLVATPDLKNGGVVADTAHLKARDFTPRPLGGTSLVEGSVEYRFQVWRQLGGAAFVDGGIVGDAGLRNLANGNGAVTPGVGVRYRSPVGPIRVDIAFNPSIAEELPVYTERPVANGRAELVPLDKKYRYQPATRFLDRLTFHFSIGEAF